MLMEGGVEIHDVYMFGGGREGIFVGLFSLLRAFWINQALSFPYTPTHTHPSGVDEYIHG